MGWKVVSIFRRQLYFENMRKNMQFSLISISCTLVALQIYLTLFYSKNKVTVIMFITFNTFSIYNLTYDFLDRGNQKFLRSQ